MDQMRTLKPFIVFLTLTMLVISGFGWQVPRAAQSGSAEAGSLNKKIRRFAPTVMTANTARLSPNDRKALKKIIAAAKLYDSLYLRQIWSGNETLLKKLQADPTPLGRMRLHYFMINKGPWSQLDDNQPFIEGVPPRPPTANFYPSDMTKDEFNSWLNTLSAGDKEKATGYFYVIRRDAAAKLSTVPYSEEYREFLEPAAKLLREAAALTTNATLRDFLNQRAAAFVSNDYYQSDVAWMDLDSPIDLTMGPYETYEDELFGYKAAFEAYVTLLLTHELMHGLGPHNINVNGEQTTVRKQLKELYSAIEEAKADVTGLWALQYLIDKGVVDREMERTLYTTNLASMFRSVRFGINEAHGRGVAMQFNYLTDEGAIRYDEQTGRFSVDQAKFKAAVRKLTHELPTIETEGSYDQERAILGK